MNEESLVYRLRERSRIRRQIITRKSVLENKPDRIADLLEESADEIERLLSDKDVFGTALMGIGNKAHYQSTGPAIPDVLWEIRGTAYSALREID